MINKKYLAKKHTGMRVCLHGFLRNGMKKQCYDSEMFKEIMGHFELLGKEFYAGNIKIVDEFLQLYCLDKERPKIEEKKAGEK